MQNYKFTVNNDCIVSGRQDLLIRFNYPYPEDLLLDKSLVGLDNGELKEALDKPFYLIQNLLVGVKYKGDDFNFIIPKDYDWNGANVPFFCWLIIGQQKEPRFKLASMVHDYICEHKGVINYNRYLSTLIFETLCEYFGRFNDVKRWAMFHSVDNFQKLQRGWK
jgi:hypothetical protein